MMRIACACAMHHKADTLACDAVKFQVLAREQALRDLALPWWERSEKEKRRSADARPSGAWYPGFVFFHVHARTTRSRARTHIHAHTRHTHTHTTHTRHTHTHTRHTHTNTHTHIGAAVSPGRRKPGAAEADGRARGEMSPWR